MRIVQDGGSRLFTELAHLPSPGVQAEALRLRCLLGAVWSGWSYVYAMLEASGEVLRCVLQSDCAVWSQIHEVLQALRIRMTVRDRDVDRTAVL